MLLEQQSLCLLPLKTRHKNTEVGWTGRYFTCSPSRLGLVVMMGPRRSCSPHQSLTTASDGIHKSTHRMVMAASAILGAGLQFTWFRWRMEFRWGQEVENNNNINSKKMPFCPSPYAVKHLLPSIAITLLRSHLCHVPVIEAQYCSGQALL